MMCGYYTHMSGLPFFTGLWSLILLVVVIISVISGILFTWHYIKRQLTNNLAKIIKAEEAKQNYFFAWPPQL